MIDWVHETIPNAPCASHACITLALPHNMQAMLRIVRNARTKDTAHTAAVTQAS